VLSSFYENPKGKNNLCHSTGVELCTQLIFSYDIVMNYTYT
jgi:hypothetical protein